MHRIRLISILAIAMLAALVLAACSDDGGGDEDPQELLQATFSNDDKISSGVFDLSLDVTTEGGDDAGTFEGSLGGPFQSEEGAFPQFDLSAEANLDSESQDFNGSAGITSAGGAAFVSFQDSDYEVPQELFDQFTSSFVQLQEQNEEQAGEGGNFLSSLGIDPTGWLTDLENEGEEDVEGTETVKVTGEADVPGLVEDLKKIAENAPQAAQRVTPEQLAQLDELVDVIENADFSIYTGADDDLLRKIEGTMDLQPAEGEGASESVSLEFSLTLSELNEPQEIAAPANPQPLQGLLEQFGIDAGSLGDLGGAVGGGGSGASEPSGTLPEAGGSPQPPSGDASQAYLECLQNAQGAAAVQQCAELIQ